MDDNIMYLFAAFLISWLVIGAYLWSLGRQVQALRDEVEILTEERQTVEAPASRPVARTDREQPEQRAVIH